MRSSSRPRRGGGRRRPMERNRVAWMMLHRLRLTPTDPAWKQAHVFAERHHKGPAR
jgi:hypothetical protein